MDKRLIDAQQLISWGLNANCVRSVLKTLKPVRLASFGKSKYILGEFQEAWKESFGIFLEVPETMPYIPEVWLRKVVVISRKKSNISMHRGAIPSDIVHILSLKGRMNKKEITFWLRFLMMKRMFLKPTTYQFRKASFDRPIGKQFNEVVNKSLSFLLEREYILGFTVNNETKEYCINNEIEHQLYTNVVKMLLSFRDKPSSKHFGIMRRFMACATHDEAAPIEKTRHPVPEKELKDIFPRSNRRKKAYEIMK